MAFHPDELALLAAIHAFSKEDAPRLVYADWLQENDRPKWAEFIGSALVMRAAGTILMGYLRITGIWLERSANPLMRCGAPSIGSAAEGRIEEYSHGIEVCSKSASALAL
jgi:uncharacterized protein (TIGR02996 family)